MKSPFPGMDPYLEAHWQDVHQRVCTYACDQIQGKLGKDLVARLGERLIVEAPSDEPRTIYPDVRVVKRSRSKTAWAESEEEDAGGGVAVETAVAEPMIVKVDGEAEPQGFVEIIEPDSGRLVTVIEFLSASNKLGSGRRKYRQKLKELSAAKVSIVEFDLLRAGRRTLSLPNSQFPRSVKTPYCACVRRGWQRDRFELYPISLQARLPAIRIPLRKTDKDIVLSLQPLIDQAYLNGRYDRTDYQKPCIPPLMDEDAKWMDELLKARR